MTTVEPFSTPFLSAFVLTPDALPFTDKEMASLDEELAEYEQVFMDPEVERHLISNNELLASFAISKAENSSLTLQEAQEVYGTVVQKRAYDFITKKLSAGKKLTVRDYEKLEFFNIAKTFRTLNQRPFHFSQLTPAFLQRIHRSLTLGMDVFHAHLPDFTAYKSGAWRDNDLIRVGDYIPAPYRAIPRGVRELIAWLKKNASVTGIAVFHTALYALHPFNNGNKRVCRIIEHLLLRGLGMNQKNLYSTSYYYHTQKERYYKYLLYSLERKNLNHFTSFALEAFVLSLISVIKTSVEARRNAFLDKASLDEKEKEVVRPLAMRREIQFKTLIKLSPKIARQTFVTYLRRAVDKKVVVRRQEGKAVYYQLNLRAPEYKVMERWLALARERLSFLPGDVLLS